MSSGSACWILWLTPMDWLALSIGRSGSQPLEYSVNFNTTMSVYAHVDDKKKQNIVNEVFCGENVAKTHKNKNTLS